VGEDAEGFEKSAYKTIENTQIEYFICHHK
jgi:hypothetical protein